LFTTILHNKCLLIINLHVRQTY